VRARNWIREVFAGCSAWLLRDLDRTLVNGSIWEHQLVRF
jgi:hypothetical protein